MIDNAQKIGLVFQRLNENVRKHFTDNFDQIRRIKTPYGELGEILYHIFDSPNVWINYLSEKEVILQPYNDLKTRDEFYNEWKMVEKRLLDYIDTIKDPGTYKKKMHIVFEPGEEIDTSVEELLMHISHHGFYHRGTLGAIIRVNGITPLPSSNWFFVLKN